MNRRIAWKIFVYGPIKWDVPMHRWRRAVHKILKCDSSRKGWMNLMRGKDWGDKND